jgi:hypothetical protein
MSTILFWDVEDVILYLLENDLILYSNVPYMNAETVIGRCDELVA